MNFFQNILGGAGFQNDLNINRYEQQDMFQDSFQCYPSIFSDRTDIDEGVLEFTAQEGQCIVPLWLFNNLLLEPGSQVQVSLATKVPKGKFVKIQPHQTEFIEIQDPRAFLEVKLRSFTCLTVGDTIHLKLLENKVFQVDILEVKPNNPTNSICVIEADVEVDFAEPLDYQEQQMLKEKENNKKQDDLEQIQKIQMKSGFQGEAVRIDGKKINQQQKQKAAQADLKNHIEQSFDPRKHRLKNGLRQKPVDSQKYTGKSYQMK